MRDGRRQKNLQLNIAVKRNAKKFKYDCLNLSYFSGRFSPLKPGNPGGIKGKNLVEAQERVLVTSGWTSNAKCQSKSGPKNLPNIT